MVQVPDDVNVVDGHDAIHFPPDARRLLEHVRQNLESPTHELHEESQADNHSSASVEDNLCVQTYQCKSDYQGPRKSQKDS